MIVYKISTGTWSDSAYAHTLARDNKESIENVIVKHEDDLAPWAESISDILVDFERGIVEFKYIDFAGDAEKGTFYLQKMEVDDE